MKIKNIVFIITGVLISFSSCTKFLDQQPVSTASDQTTWQSDGDANASVAGCYSLIRAAFNASVSYYAYGDLPSDEFGAILDGDYQQIRNVSWAISVPGVNTYDPKLKLRIYTPFYSAIQQSNRCLHFLNRMPSSDFNGNSEQDQIARKNKYIAEAYFTRAFNYFYISRVWGDVPLDTSYQEDISTFQGIARTPQKEVLASCIADLNIAKKNLAWRDMSSSDRVVRADKGGVFALLAHIYAWKGQYDSCRMACDSVIDNGGYSLVDKNNYSSIYKGQSVEGIFEIAQNSPQEALNSTFGGDIDPYHYKNGGTGLGFFTLYAPILPGANPFPLWQIDTIAFNKLYSDSNDIRYKNEFVKLVPDLTAPQSYYYACIKYSDLGTVNKNSVSYYYLQNNIIIFRLADIKLLRAEALSAQSSPDYTGALQDVNDIRARAGLTSISSVIGREALIDTITAERGRELFLEGHRYYDLVRNERLTGISNFIDYANNYTTTISQSEFLAGKYYWPLDPSLFALNPLLTQTPFWAQLLGH